MQLFLLKLLDVVFAMGMLLTAVQIGNFVLCVSKYQSRFRAVIRTSLHTRSPPGGRDKSATWRKRRCSDSHPRGKNSTLNFTNNGQAITMICLYFLGKAKMWSVSAVTTLLEMIVKIVQIYIPKMIGNQELGSRTMCFQMFVAFFVVLIYL